MAISRNVVMAALIFLGWVVAQTSLSYALSIYGVSEFIISLTIYPMLEEVLKFSFFLILGYRAIYFVAIFVVFELLFVKGSFIIEYVDLDYLYLFQSLLPSIVLHVSTAYCYYSTFLNNAKWLALAFCIAIHALFNLYSSEDADILIFFTFGTLIASCPVFFGMIAQKMSKG